MSRFLLRAGACAVCLLVFACATHAALIVASDNAANSVYNDGWQSGDNGNGSGPGYVGWGGGWVFRNGGNTVQTNPSGSFFGAFANTSLGNNSPAGAGGDSNSDGDINTPANASGRAWGMYANTANELYAVRPLPSQMTVGQTLKWEFDNGNIDSTRVVGVRLLANASDISTRQMEVRFVGGDSFYNVFASSSTTTTHGFSREGFSVEYTLTTPTTFSLKLTRKQTGVTQTITGTNINPGGNTAINAIAFRNLSAGSGATNNSYFNNISLTNANVAHTVNDDTILNVMANDPNPSNNPVTHMFTATNPDFDALTWSGFAFDSYVAAYGGSGSGPAIAATFNNGNQAFSWNTTGSARGIYKWKVDASDGAVSDTGFLTVHVTEVPEPATATICCLAIMAFAVLRRRN